MIAEKEQTRHVVAAAFDDRSQAESAIHALTQAGFHIDSIGVAMRSHQEQDALIEHTGAHKTAEPLTEIVEGGLIGGMVGAIVSLGVLSVPGVGPVIAGGVLASTLAGAGIGAASGGVQAALTHLGLSEEQANALETRFHAGAAIVTIDVENGRAGEADARLMDEDQEPAIERIETAQAILGRSGAAEVDATLSADGSPEA